MKKRSFNTLLPSLLKIYFSDIPHKNFAYKREIYMALRDMGGIYIKFLQVLCVSHKFMDGWSTLKDYEVFNKVDVEFIDVKRYLLSPEVYANIDLEPFAAGSFAQVYKATLVSGEDVVIKMLRPSVYKTIEKDLKRLRRLIKIVRYFLPESFLDYRKLYEEFASNSLMETDYEEEVANMKYFYKYYEHHPYVVVPKVYEELCTKTIIVQEFIDGPTLADLIMDSSNSSLAEKGFQKTGSDFWRQIIIVGGEALRTAITSDYVYGDPHLGNIILLPNDKVALVDFGLVAKKPLSQEAFYLWMKAYYDILLGKKEYDELLETTCMCFCPDVTNALRKYFGSNNFVSLVSSILNKEAQKLLMHDAQAMDVVANGHLFTLFLDFVNSTKSIRLKFDMRNYQLLKAMQAFIGSVTILSKNEKDKIYTHIMIESMKYAIDCCEKEGVVHDSNLSTTYSKNESYELLVDFLTAIADNDEFLFDKLTERMNL